MRNGVCTYSKKRAIKRSNPSGHSEEKTQREEKKAGAIEDCRGGVRYANRGGKPRDKPVFCLFVPEGSVIYTGVPCVSEGESKKAVKC